MSKVVKIGMLILFTVALSSSFIATEKPWYVSYHHQHLFPAFSYKKQVLVGEEIISYEECDWKRMNADKIIFAPVPYSPGKSDFENADYKHPSDEQFFRDKQNNLSAMPLRFRHWLGTDKRGADVLSGLLNGTRISLFVGVLSMLIAAAVGLLLGALAGYAGNDFIKAKRGVAFLMLPAIMVAFFYTSLFSFDGLLLQLSKAIAVLLLSIVVFYCLGLGVSRGRYLSKQIAIPVDAIISRVIEWVVAMPRLIIVLTIAAIAPPSILNLTLIIGFTGWTDIARLTRAEFLKHREMEYVQAAKALGYSNWRIALKHILPNAITPALVAIMFGVSSAVLAEASLSFLGIGVPQDVITWGNMLASGKENFGAWWLVVFPGAALFLTVLLFNSLAERLRAKRKF